jgi:chemotaxis protein CheD
MTILQAPNQLVAGIGEMVVSSATDNQLLAYGLGSCVALAVWDPQVKQGGLAHFMLPAGAADADTPVKFIDPGLDTFLRALEKRGVVARRSVIKAAGAAAMLAVGGGLNVGKRNAEAIQASLTARSLKLAATALGGNCGRTVQLDVTNGRFLIRSLSSITEL